MRHERHSTSTTRAHTFISTQCTYESELKIDVIRSEWKSLHNSLLVYIFLRSFRSCHFLIMLEFVSCFPSARFPLFASTSTLRSIFRKSNDKTKEENLFSNWIEINYKRFHRNLYTIAKVKWKLSFSSGFKLILCRVAAAVVNWTTTVIWKFM